ncbi:MAG: cyclic nucleotide-binding domain-containing protein, partial [Candidatus Rokuibacteriota bacterium]
MAAEPGATVTVTIDGRPAEVAPGTTVFDAARGLGIEIPTLCHAQHQTPVGVCRVCTVEVGKNARVLAASCVRAVEPGMEVQTASERVRQVRRTLYEMLLADHAAPCLRQAATGDCELETLASRAGLRGSRFAAQPSERPVDDSSPIIKVDPAACILCDRCIRACSEVKENFVIGRTGKGAHAAIAFDVDTPMGQSTCVGCGECMVSCPTGALTNKRVLDVKLPEGDQLPPADLLRLPIFAGASGTFLALNQGSIVRRRFRAGEIICGEGDQGSTAFYLLGGRVQVSISTPMAHVKSRGQKAGGLTRFLRSFTSLASSAEDPREGAETRFIPIDAPVDLAYGNPVAELGPGELFGEMTCMSFYPRSATVRALEDTEVLEMLRNVLHMLQKNKQFRAELDRRYRERALQTHLASVPMFSSVTPDFIRQLQDRVSLLRVEPGQVICRQGEPADSFFLVRIGFVKVTQSFPGGEMVLQYMPRGSYFGEVGLLGGGVRSATCTALDHVEIVQIRASDFHEMMTRFPEVRARLEQQAASRLADDQERQRRVSTVPIGDFLAQGLMEAQSLLLLDLERCTRCDACVRACAAAHDGVTRLVRDGLRFDKYLVATSCRSCRDPRCMVGCPVGSIRRRDSLEILIEDWCIGCGLCAKNCPYGNINLHSFTVDVDDETQPGRRKAVVREKATTCDLSREFHEPACVYACPHDAAIRVEPITFFADKL